MTKTWIAALMAAASLVPAMALAQNGPQEGADRQRGDWRGQQRPGERFQSRDGGIQPQREVVEASPRPEPQPQVRAQAQVEANRGGWNDQRGDRGQRDRGQPGGWNGDRDRQQTQPVPQPRPAPGGWQDRGPHANDPGANDQRRDWNRDGQRADRGQWNEQRNDRAYDRWNGRDPRRDQVRQQWNRSDADWRDHARNDMGFADRAAWNRGWRNDGRYDYGQYRSANRGAYRMPRYYAPSGWGAGYRRFSVGVSLNQSLWGENYWIDDPYDYRLPAAYGPYRWVRYYNDALLVDIRSGRVVDTVYDIFW